MNRLRYFHAPFLLSAVLLSCTQKHNDEEESRGSPVAAVVTVTTAMVTRGDIETYVTAIGKTDAIRRERIFSPIVGTLISLKVLEGIHVKRGDVVAMIQPRETHSAIVGAEALLRSARTDAERTEARRAVELAKSNQNNVPVYATFDGVVATRSVAEGELVTENAELMTMVDLSTIVFDAEVSLQDVQMVRPGERARIQFQALGDRQYDAFVGAISPRSDLQSQTVKVRLQFKGLSDETRRLLKTEMSGLVKIVTGHHTRILLVPKTALLRDDESGSFSVVAVTPDSLAHTIPVIVGTANDSIAEVRGSGLQEGMSVVIEGNYALQDSSRISVVR